jgi:hypothetical protein
MKFFPICVRKDAEKTHLIVKRRVRKPRSKTNASSQRRVDAGSAPLRACVQTVATSATTLTCEAIPTESRITVAVSLFTTFPFITNASKKVASM